MGKLSQNEVVLFEKNLSINAISGIFVGAFCILALIVFTSCGQGTTTIEATAKPIEPTSTPQPTNTSEPTDTPQLTDTPKPTDPPEATSTTEPTAELDNYASGGLGLEKVAWEQTHEFDEEAYSYHHYDGGKYVVDFVNDRISYLEVTLSDGEVPLEESRMIARDLIPQDSEFVETYVPTDQDYLKVDVYNSESLKDRFEFAQWVWSDSEPGTFIMMHLLFSDGSTLMIATGNNP